MLNGGYRVQTVESLLVRRSLEPFPRREDRDSRNTLAAFTRLVPAQGVGRLRWKEIPCNLCAAALRDRDDCRPIGRSWIRVVDDDRAAGGEGGVDQLFLPALRLPVMPHGILADVLVSGREPVPVERRLARRR